MDLALLGWPADGPTLSLDHERFAYAGKFVMSSTGKAVARTGSDVLGATAFDADRTDDSILRIRYVTVRSDRRGTGIGPQLLRFTCERAGERGYRACVIAVNNVFAYEASYRAGFVSSGVETGLAELELHWPAGSLLSGDDGDPDRARRYRSGLEVFADRDLSDPERGRLREWRERGPPAVIESTAAEPTVAERPGGPERTP